MLTPSKITTAISFSISYLQFKFTPPGGKVVLKISSELTNCDPGNAPSTHSSGKDEAHADHVRIAFSFTHI